MIDLDEEKMCYEKWRKYIYFIYHDYQHSREERDHGVIGENNGSRREIDKARRFAERNKIKSVWDDIYQFIRGKDEVDTASILDSDTEVEDIITKIKELVRSKVNKEDKND